MVKNQLAIRDPHRNLEDAWRAHVPADADEFRTGRAVYALRLVPVGAARQNGGCIRERFNIVDNRGLLPEALQRRKRRLVARLGALAFDGFEERALFAADVIAGTDEHFQIESQIRAENPLAEEAGAIARLNL